jgi:hypothetical protein
VVTDERIPGVRTWLDEKHHDGTRKQSAEYFAYSDDA